MFVKYAKRKFVEISVRALKESSLSWSSNSKVDRFQLFKVIREAVVQRCSVKQVLPATLLKRDSSIGVFL